MMQLRWIVLLGVFTTIIASTGADAQTTTLYYQSNAMTGTSDYLTAGATSLTTAPVIGSISGSIVLTGSIAASDLELSSYSFSFSGNNGSPFTLGGVVQGPYPGTFSFGNGQFEGGSVSFFVTTANGAITGASGSLGDGPYGGITLLTLGPDGDKFQYEYGNHVLGGCINEIYEGAPAINPCDVEVSSSAAGVWTVQTAPVPLPPSIWLLLTAIGPMSWVTYRSKRAAYQAAQ
jgi:hypothetical protein